MTIKFSVNKQAFYDENTDVIPEDAVVITNEQHLSLISGMNDGERRVYIGKNGELTLSDSKPSQWHTWDADAHEWYLSPEDTAQIKAEDAERKKSALRAKADVEISWRQDAIDAGIATDEERVALAAWKKFRVLLMRVNTSETDIYWPAIPEV
ncbi:tail fiber assembly protein [Citrobacter sp. C13]|uniref:tail fiber assembly protein n=1 Tax=Citrobacter TaxID=544 RepID=UPI0032B5A5E2